MTVGTVPFCRGWVAFRRGGALTPGARVPQRVCTGPTQIPPTRSGVPVAWPGVPDALRRLQDAWRGVPDVPGMGSRESSVVPLY